MARLTLASLAMDRIEVCPAPRSANRAEARSKIRLRVADASAFLVGLYVRLSSRIPDKKSVWRLFLDKIMRNLEKKKQLERLMMLLRDFLQQVSKSGRTKGGGLDEAMSGSYDPRVVTHIYVDLRYEDGRFSRRVLHYYLRRT